MNSAAYRDIVRDYLIHGAKRLYGREWYLAIDNGSCHKGQAVAILTNEVPTKLDWPSRSPDLNPIENLWALLKLNIRKRQPQDLDELEKSLL